MPEKSTGFDRIAERLGENESERNDRMNREGYEDGKNATWTDRITHNTIGSGSDSYDAGFSQGLDADDDDE